MLNNNLYQNILKNKILTLINFKYKKIYISKIKIFLIKILNTNQISK